VGLGWWGRTIVESVQSDSDIIRFVAGATRTKSAETTAFAEQNGLQMIYRKQYESPRYPEMRLRKPLFAAMVDAAAKVMNFLLPGKTDVRHGDYHVILRKR